jgi:tight adherence protein B
VVGLALWLLVGPLVVAVAMLLFGFTVAGAIVGVIIVAPMIGAATLRSRRHNALEVALPAVVDLVSRSLRTGASFRQAFAEAASDGPQPAASELERILDEVDRGRPVDAAIAAWVERRPLPEVRVVAAALAVAAENEAGSMRALDGVSQALRDRAQLNAEIRALAAQSTSSMVVLVALPLLFIVVGAVVDSRATNFLFGDAFGRLCLTSGIALDVVGWLWMRRLVKARMP